MRRLKVVTLEDFLRFGFIYFISFYQESIFNLKQKQLKKDSFELSVCLARFAVALQTILLNTLKMKFHLSPD